VIRCLHFLLFGVFAIYVNGQTYNPNFSKSLNKINRSVDLVRQYESFGIKSPGSQAKTNTYNWIVDEYRSYGYDSIRVDSFIQDGTIVRNIVVTKPGQDSSYMIVCGHYDTRNGPGASDNGSGVSAILEAARILKDLETTRGIQFIHFDREEDGFKGSNYHVLQQIGPNRDEYLYLVFNVDQIGGSKGQPNNNKITCERDEDNNPDFNNALSWLITDTVSNLCNLYTTLTPEISSAFLSDYVPFEKQGYVISGLYQSAPDVFGHSAADTLGNMDTVSFKQAVRLATTSVMYFAQVPQFVSAKPINKSEWVLFPNPANQFVYLPKELGKAKDFQVVSLSGKRLRNYKLLSDGRLDTSQLPSDVYILRAMYSDSVVQHRLVVLH
jgi:aminopeptidase YwaD